MIMYTKYQVKSILLIALLILSINATRAESTYGYNANGTGTVTATAKVTLRVTVSKLILLKVGSAGATASPLSWNVVQNISAASTQPTTTADNVAAPWDGNTPSNSTVTNPAALAVSAWTNATTTSTVNCAIGTWTGPAGGPSNVNFSVASTGTLGHPGTNLNACTATALAKNTVATGTWAYTLGGTPNNWPAGVYTNTITYTAAGI
jgi:hypothetical protein